MELENKTPASGQTLAGAMVVDNRKVSKPYASADGKASASGKFLCVRMLDAASPAYIRLKGRDKWALCELLRAGEGGCTPITNPAPRWSAYIFKLRRAGLNIETITETHGGAYAGHHARYVLRSRVEIVPEAAQ